MGKPRSVVVVGSGAGGMSAAVSAAAAGARVTVLEAAERMGGTTSYSGGGIWIPGNPWAAAAGSRDSEEDGLRYLAGLDLGDTDPHLADAYVRQGMRAVRGLEAAASVRWQHLDGFCDYHVEVAGGSSFGRSLEIEPVQAPPGAATPIRPDPYGLPPVTINEEAAGGPAPAELEARLRDGVVVRGRGLIAGLHAALLRHGGRVLCGARAEALIVADGEVVGVEAGGRQYSGEVVIASGGFERNPDLVRSFLRGPLLAPASPPSNVGDGLVLGMSVGAALGSMSEAWWCPAIQIEGESIDGAPFYRMLFTDCAHPGGVIVDGRGRRFVNEATNYNDLGRAFHAFDAAGYAYPAATSWLVFDERRQRERGFHAPSTWSLDPAKTLDGAGAESPQSVPSWLVRASTLDELADSVGLPREELCASIARFNAHAADGVDPDFGRGAFAYDRFSQRAQPIRPVAEPPFYALSLKVGALGTKGGLAIDARGRVLRADRESAIPGLYAAGNATASPFGAAYPGPGATIGPALVFGWLAGETAAARTGR